MSVPVYKKLDDAAADLKAGKVGVIPTDTIYGLVACAINQDAALRVIDVKGRKNKPGTILAASINQLVELGLKRRYLTAVEQYWPGAISVIIPTGPWLDYLHQGKYSLAVRIPDYPELQALLQRTGPLITTSANMADKNPSKDLKDAMNYFHDKIDFYVDGGTLNGEASTVIRIVDDAVEVLREGAVKIDEETGRIIK